MKSPSLSRRIYNSSFTLAISFSFYALIFLFTLSCEGEETSTLSVQDHIEADLQAILTADSTQTDDPGAVSYVE